MRMNDIHDATHESIFDFNKLKVNHPEYLFATKENPPKCGKWSAVDYGHDEIRKLAFEYVKEVCCNYNIDGIELDFCRHKMFFKKTSQGIPAGNEELEQMTGLIRRIRKMTEEVALERNKPILLAIRIPDSLEYNKIIGLDIETWLAEGLVDIMVTGDSLQFNTFEYSVNLAHKYGVKIYPCLSAVWIKDEEDRDDSEYKRKLVANNVVQANYIYKWSYTRNSLECYRARAMNAWCSGADGIYMFNFTNPYSPVWKELGDPEILKNLDKVYVASVLGLGPAPGKNCPEYDFINIPTVNPQAPLKLTPGVKQNIEIFIGDDVNCNCNANDDNNGKNYENHFPANIECSISLYARVSKLDKSDDITVKVNDIEMVNGIMEENQVVYKLVKEFIKQGQNNIEIMAKKYFAELRDLKIYISYSKYTQDNNMKDKHI
ncbi:MAG: hypothetical protein GX754_03305 [Clostridiaceae bacterium]|nr:hypothetical protein [Clostridiaceae bacterium]